MTDSVGRFYQHVQRVDSLNNARWTAEHDADSAAYAEIQDSLSARSAQGVQARQKLSELEAASSNAEGSSDNFLSSLSGFQSLPGTCSEAPIYDVDLTTLHMGRMEINLNGYPWVLSLSRGLFRFLGAVSAVTMIMGSLKIFSMTKKES
jgi:hypothetical protein